MNGTAERSLQFMAGGGKVGALMRSHDWSRSPLGPPTTWPQSLRSVVGLLLESRFPMFVAWGKDLGFLYNDAYAEILGAKHPRALGSRFYDIWSEIWPDISPLIASAMAGEATYREDLPLVMNRRGFDEETWFTFSYSPVRDEDGAVAGMFCAVAETTEKVVAEKAFRDSDEALRHLNATLELRVADALAERKVLADIVEETDIIVIVASIGPARTHSRKSMAHAPRSATICVRCCRTGLITSPRSGHIGTARSPASALPPSTNSATRRSHVAHSRCVSVPSTDPTGGRSAPINSRRT